ncbi:hypothetical protein B0T18DRAFT_238681 [Schizothecium vesticola]|uniref:Uncharacterized protein n=1 Tax=Schizothecium vesticola TaxID=314040 RepID=A0AA40EE35_9PEZI|nr:hypothetical protein B0T18DRAFT_238681 [Schizothecium vesticola]
MNATDAPLAVFTIDYRRQRIVDPSPIDVLQRHRSRARLLLGPCGTLTYRYAWDSDEPAMPIASEMAVGDRNCHPMQRALSYLIARPVGTPFNPRRSPNVVVQIRSDHIKGWELSQTGPFSDQTPRPAYLTAAMHAMHAASVSCWLFGWWRYIYTGSDRIESDSHCCVVGSVALFLALRRRRGPPSAHCRASHRRILSGGAAFVALMLLKVCGLVTCRLDWFVKALLSFWRS